MDDRNLLRRLVEIESPTGSEGDAVEFLQDQAHLDGLRIIEDEAGNFVAEAGRGDRLLLFVGHVDTVPGKIPVREEDGELWGRGSVDAKGALAAAYCAARRFRFNADVRIRVVGAVDEEGMSRGVAAIPRDLAPEWILVGEPSGVAGVTLGYKGIVRGTLTATRSVTHGASGTDSAADVVTACWSDLRARLAPRPVFDAMQARLDALRTETDGLVARAVASFQLRLPPSRSPVQVGRLAQSVADRYGVHLDVAECVPAVVAPRRSPLVAAMLSAIRAQGFTPRLLRKTGTADMNRLALMFPGVPIAAYGPGDSALDHTPEERLALAEFDAAVRVLGDCFRRATGRVRPVARPVPMAR